MKSSLRASDFAPPRLETSIFLGNLRVVRFLSSPLILQSHCIHVGHALICICSIERAPAQAREPCRCHAADGMITETGSSYFPVWRIGKFWGNGSGMFSS
jgi:hypothetical protein